MPRALWRQSFTPPELSRFSVGIRQFRETGIENIFWESGTGRRPLLRPAEPHSQDGFPIRNALTQPYGSQLSLLRQ